MYITCISQSASCIVTSCAKKAKGFFSIEAQLSRLCCSFGLESSLLAILDFWHTISQNNNNNNKNNNTLPLLAQILGLGVPAACAFAGCFAASLAVAVGAHACNVSCQIM
jgi:hypothetical protein